MRAISCPQEILTIMQTISLNEGHFLTLTKRIEKLSGDFIRVLCGEKQNIKIIFKGCSLHCNTTSSRCIVKLTCFFICTVRS